MLASPTILEQSVAGLVHRYTVGMDGDAVDKLAAERLRAIQKTAQVRGFRRGRAPLGVVRSHHGRRVTATIIERSAVEVASTLVAEKKLQPAGRPIIEICNEGGEIDGRINFTLTLEVLPRVELQSIDKFELFRLVAVPGHSGSETDWQAEGKCIGANVLARCRERSRQHLKQQIFDKLSLDYTFAVPTGTARKEHERITAAYRQTIEDHVSLDLDREFLALAERRVRLALVLTAIGRHHQLEMPREEVERLVEAQAERDPEHESEIVDFYLDHPTALAELRSTLYEDRVVDLILQRAVVHDRPMTADELLATSEGEYGVTV